MWRSFCSRNSNFDLYSQDAGNQLAVVDESNEHILSVWDLTKDKPRKITETKVGQGHGDKYWKHQLTFPEIMLKIKPSLHWLHSMHTAHYLNNKGSTK